MACMLCAAALLLSCLRCCCNRRHKKSSGPTDPTDSLYNDPTGGFHHPRVYTNFDEFADRQATAVRYQPDATYTVMWDQEPRPLSQVPQSFYDPGHTVTMPDDNIYPTTSVPSKFINYHIHRPPNARITAPTVRLNGMYYPSDNVPPGFTKYHVTK